MLTYRIEYRHEEDKAATHLDEYLSSRSSTLTQEMLTLNEVLYATGSVFESRLEVTPKEFQAITRSALARHTEIQALEWVPRVPREERQAYEQKARSEGLEENQITDHLPDGRTVPSPDRTEYFPVCYVEPLEGNEPALGFDLGSDPTRRAAIVRATQSRKPTLTDPIVLVQETGSFKGLLGVLPVYSESVDTAAAAPALPRGFVVLAFRITDILDRAIPRLGHEHSTWVHFELIDEDVDGKPALIYASPGDKGESAPAYMVSERRIALGGQHWRLIARPTRAFVSEHMTAQPVWFGFSVFLVWEALAGLLIALGKRLRDSAVKERDRMLRSVCVSMNDGVVVADRNGKFLLFNEAAEDMIGAGAMDVSPAEWSRTYGCFLPDGVTPYPADQLPLWRALRGERVSEAEVLIRHPNRPTGVWLSISGAPLLGDDGSIDGGAIVIRDITSRKASEDSQRRLSNALEQTDDTVFITDRGGKIEYVNPAFEATTGYTRDEAIGQTPRILKSGAQDEAYYKSLWTSILNGQVHRGITVNRRRNGDLYYAEQTITPMKDSSGRITHFVSVVKDITERRKTEQLELEVQLAALVQRKLYPQLSPKIPGLDVAGAVFPAKVVCGDYFDYLAMKDEGFGIVVGDVMGHGFGPALVMAATRAQLRSLVKTHSDLGEILTSVSQTLSADLEDDNFVTLLVARIDTHARELTYVNAGHPSGYVLDGNGTLKAELVSTGVPLGVSPENGHCASKAIPLDTGDLVVLLTDGVTESQTPGGEILDAAGALEVIRAHHHEPVRDIVNHIHRAARDFAGGLPQEDDIAVVVCRVQETAR